MCFQDFFLSLFNLFYVCLLYEFSLLKLWKFFRTKGSTWMSVFKIHCTLKLKSTLMVVDCWHEKSIFFNDTHLVTVFSFFLFKERCWSANFKREISNLKPLFDFRLFCWKINWKKIEDEFEIFQFSRRYFSRIVSSLIPL